MGIVLKDVSKIYDTGEVKTFALNKVSLEIKEGEFLVILGPSGSGKSTLLNVISGLDTPTSGEIYFNEDKISHYKDDELTLFRRNNLGFIFQQYNLLQNLTVRENVDIGANISKDPLNIDDVIKRVGLEGEKNKYPSQLSGGQQQRVSIARSIAKKPMILFCDEPTGALDEETAREVLTLLEEMNKEYKTTMVIITHNAGISEMGDRVIKMNSGKIAKIIENTNKKKASEIIWG
ncbi:MAG: ABC transporter ATP-binding protein [Clostridium sp.]